MCKYFQRVRLFQWRYFYKRSLFRDWFDLNYRMQNFISARLDWVTMGCIMISLPEFPNDWDLQELTWEIDESDILAGDWLPFRLSPVVVAPAVLSTAHIRPSVTWRAGASSFAVTLGKSPIDPVKSSRGIRGSISSFSRQSRSRLMRRVSEIRRDRLPLFVTLTYPKIFQHYDFKRDLKVFLQRLKRAYPDVCGIWKLEPQKRGAAHFHLLLWGVEYSEVAQGLEFWEWVALTWYQVVGSGDCFHYLWHMGLLGGGNKPCVQVIESQRGVFFYVSKYMSKLISVAVAEWGRWWGVVNDYLLPRGELITIPLVRESAIEIIRYMRRFAFRKGSRSRSRSYRSLSIICDASFWVRQLIW